MQELKERHRDVMQEVLMDVLRALSAPNMDIRAKTLGIALDLVTARNIDEVGDSLWAGNGGVIGWGLGASGAAGQRSREHMCARE